MGDLSFSLPALTDTTTNDLSQTTEILRRQDSWWTPTPPSLPAWTPQPTPTWSQPANPSWAATSLWSPLATATGFGTPPQGTITYKRDRFGSIAWTALGGVFALVLVICLIWGWRQHRRGLRPFDISGCCTGKRRKTPTSTDERAAPVPFSGAGRHYDQRPILGQPLQPSESPTNPTTAYAAGGSNLRDSASNSNAQDS